MDLNVEARSLIEEVVRDRFGDASIVSVHVREDEDFDGDIVLYVTVVFDAKKPLDSDKTNSIVRHTRHRLMHERDDRAFPVFSFVSKSDASRLKTAAA